MTRLLISLSLSLALTIYHAICDIVTCEQSSCRCTQPEECIINCIGVDYCASSVLLTCKPGYTCTIKCIGDSACVEASIDGSKSTDFSIICDGRDACKDATIDCGSGDCTMECINRNADGLCAITMLNLFVAPNFQCSNDCPTTSPTPTISVTLSNNPSPNPTQSSLPNTLITSTNNPSLHPSNTPSSHPSLQSSNIPSFHPSLHPSNAPSLEPHPSPQPSNDPTSHPSIVPSNDPTSHPSTVPSHDPTSHPSPVPSNMSSIDATTSKSIYTTQMYTTNRKLFEQEVGLIETTDKDNDNTTINNANTNEHFIHISDIWEKLRQVKSSILLIGIVVSVVFVCFILCCIGLCIKKHRRNNKLKYGRSESFPINQEDDTQQNINDDISTEDMVVTEKKYKHSGMSEYRKRDLKQICTDCGQTKKGDIYECDSLFYCFDCIQYLDIDQKSDGMCEQHVHITRNSSHSNRSTYTAVTGVCKSEGIYNSKRKLSVTEDGVFAYREPKHESGNNGMMLGEVEHSVTEIELPMVNKDMKLAGLIPVFSYSEDEDEEAKVIVTQFI